MRNMIERCNPLWAAIQEPRSYSARYSGWDDDKAWSSQEWKADELMDDRTGTPVVCSWARTHEFQPRPTRESTPAVRPQRGARPQQSIIGDDETEWEWSLGPRSFLDRVNDVIWGMFMSVTLESAVFMRKNYSDNWHSIKNTKDLTMEQMFDIFEKLISEQSSPQNRVIQICTDAGFLNVVEIGQYFMTKDTAEFSQFTDAVACREYTLPRDEEAYEPKGWIRGNTKIGHILEVTTCCLQGKYGVQIRIMSMNRDNSHSWVRISHDVNKVVTNLNNDEQETSEVQFSKNMR